MTPKITPVLGSDAVLLPPQHSGQIITVNTTRPVTVHHTSEQTADHIANLRHELAKARNNATEWQQCKRCIVR